MKIRWWRIVGTGIAAEVAAIALLIVLVAVFGPADAAAAQSFAERHGQWGGPLGGVVFCFLGGYWVARSAAQRPIVHGSLVGAATAALDVALLVASGAPFHWIFFASNLGRILAGALGGWTTTRRAAKAE